MDERELQELDEGYRQDLALAASRPRQRTPRAGSEHLVLHLLQHPEARPEQENESVVPGSVQVQP
ncbi:hypothetical protein [Deinococcus phoenicis]|uniref:hypothetical protein n=1 Tax=Deinococcus phoenicis TaxID=1476583 RepID=UPI0012690CD8|nr:hypothetical protein [Deinococcus phoenicis]